MEVAYAPEVVFRGEPLTFRVSAEPSAPVTVRANGVERAGAAPAGPEIREITLRPEDAMTVEFLGEGEAGWSFRLLRPDETVELSETDGFLFIGDVPVVLLPDHRLPPPLDRRWETVELLENA